MPHVRLPLVLLGAILLAGCPPSIKSDPATHDTSGDADPDDSATPVDTALPEDTAETDTTLDDLPPIAVALGPTSVRAGEVAILDGSGSSDPQGYEIVGFHWTCTDGTTATGPTVDVTFAIPGDIVCDLTVTSASSLTGSASTPIQVLATDFPRWTLMLFLNGDNNLEGSAIKDMNEMEVVGSNADVNIVVQMDRARGGDSSNDNWTGARRFLVEKDEDTRSLGSATVMDLGSVDSGIPETIIDFATWAMETYPAEHYAFVFWDHGDGWSFTGESGGTKDLSYDDAERSAISVARGDMEAALGGITSYLGRPLDLLGMDACLMGSWEIAFVSAPYADVYVSSQASEGMDGWAYDTALADLVATPDMDAATLGDIFAKRFNETRDDTLSVVDLANLDVLNITLDDLATTLMASEVGGDILQDAAHDAQSFDYSGSDRDIGDLLDLMATVAEVPIEVATSIASAQLALESVVLANYTHGRDVTDAHGLSIYAPTRRMESLYLEGSWAAGSLWDDLLTQVLGGY